MSDQRSSSVAEQANPVTLSEALGGGVDPANESAVTFLARLPNERCELAECPGWLSVSLERFRRPAGQRR